MTSHQQSSLELDIGLIENNVDVYSQERFIDLTDPVADLHLKIVKRPQDITQEDYLFVDYLEHVIANTGSYQLSPFSFNWNHLRRIYTILKHFQRFTRNIPLSSCRLDEIARDPGLATLIADFSGSTNITSAVEGISERICNALEKSLSNEEFIQGVKTLISSGFNGIKFYFIYTGLETMEDVEEFKQRLDVINQFKHQFKNNCNVRTSFTPLHSTLGTPTAYHGSKVAKSLKSGDRVFRAIRAACSQHNIGIRLSASLGSVDVGQIMSMSDRRTQPLIEYIGLNGIRPNKPLRVLLYVPEQEITESQYMRTARTERVKIKTEEGEKFYRVSNTWNFQTERLYMDVNENYLYPKMTASEIEGEILKWWRANPHGAPAPIILQHMQPNAAAKFAPPKGKMLVQQLENPYTLGYTEAQPGTAQKPILSLVTDRSIGEAEAEDVKRLFTYFTGGQTFNDVIEDKSALHVLPDAHMIITQSRHPGWGFSKYIGSLRANLSTTYCFEKNTLFDVNWNGEMYRAKIEGMFNLWAEPSNREGVMVDGPDGYVPVTNIIDMGEQDCITITIEDGSFLTVTPDHKIDVSGVYDEMPLWKTAAELTAADSLRTRAGALKVVNSAPAGTRHVYDLTVNHPNHRMYANTISASNCHSSSLAACLSCGQCNTQSQIRSVSAPRASMETGHRYLSMAIKEYKSYDISHRLLVALQIQDGAYSSMIQPFIRHAMNRALLKGSNASWTKPMLYDKSWNNRTPYTFRESESKSSLAGQMLFEISMNYDFSTTRQEDIDKVTENARRFTTKGWQIERVVRLGDSTNPLTNTYDTVILQYLIDTRHFDVSMKQLEMLAHRINTKRTKHFTIATHKAAGRDVMRVVPREIPVEKIKGVFVNRTMSPHHISLSVITTATNAHPQSLLAAMLNRAVDHKDDRIGQSGRVQPHITRVLGHYQSVNIKSALIQSAKDGTIICPHTKEVKLLNIVTGKPFGAAAYEQNPTIPEAGQTLFLQRTAVAGKQWWPKEPKRVSV